MPKKTNPIANRRKGASKAFDQEKGAPDRQRQPERLLVLEWQPVVHDESAERPSAVISRKAGSSRLYMRNTASRHTSCPRSSRNLDRTGSARASRPSIGGATAPGTSACGGNGHVCVKVP